mgnify:FL=1
MTINEALKLADDDRLHAIECVTSDPDKHGPEPPNQYEAIQTLAKEVRRMRASELKQYQDIVYKT